MVNLQNDWFKMRGCLRRSFFFEQFLVLVVELASLFFVAAVPLKAVLVFEAIFDGVHVAVFVLAALDVVARGSVFKRGNAE